MTFGQSIKTCFSKYAVFRGRASRSEFWWFNITLTLVAIILDTVSRLFPVSSTPEMIFLGISLLIYLATLLPVLAVTVRRLHDRDFSGWWLLLVLIPLLGWLVLFIFMVLRGTEGENRFGPSPLLAPSQSPPQAPSQATVPPSSS